MTRSDSRLRRILNNLGNLLISIVLAVLVWIVAVQEANPNIEKLYTTPLPIVEQNQPAGMLVYGESARQVRVTLSGPQSAWDVLTPDRLAVTVDLGQQVSGTLELPVQVTVADRTFRVVKVEPSVITLKMEPLAEKRVPVNVSVVGDPALGYAASPIVIQPGHRPAARAVITGATSHVGQRASVDSGCARLDFADIAVDAAHCRRPDRARSLR